MHVKMDRFTTTGLLYMREQTYYIKLNLETFFLFKFEKILILGSQPSLLYSFAVVTGRTTF